jgi:hypothetical protein
LSSFIVFGYNNLLGFIEQQKLESFLLLMCLLCWIPNQRINLKTLKQFSVLKTFI